MRQSQSSTSWSVLGYPPASATLFVQGLWDVSGSHAVVLLSPPHEKSPSRVRPNVGCSGDGAVGITGAERGNGFV